MPGAAPALTVVLPLYNGAATIAETLDSVRGQTLPDIEVIVVDDGSSDDGVARVRAHAVGASLLEQPHLGVAVARNRGLAAARGRWVAFLDQDDLWHPAHAARTVGWLEAHSNERIAFVTEVAFSARDEIGQLQLMDELAGSWAHHLVGDVGAIDALVDAVDAGGDDGDRVQHHDVHAMLKGPISMTTSFIADPDLLRLAGGFAPHALAMDDYWLLVNVARIHPIAQLAHATVFYRVHVGATSRTTKLGLPFLSSAVALRLGGGLVPATGTQLDPTGDLHRHLLLELIHDDRYRNPRFRRVVDALADILWPHDSQWWIRRRALWSARLPWLRHVRARLRGMHR